MCGIVGAVAQRDVIDILLEGLRRLEYRGYDSAGVAVVNNQNELVRVRSVWKVSELVKKIEDNPQEGSLGIAHTRWATHGKPSENNAHLQYVVFLYTLFYFHLIINSCCSGSGFQPGGSFFRG